LQLTALCLTHLHHGHLPLQLSLLMVLLMVLLPRRLLLLPSWRRCC
jgi:hypothetical protein